jgi:hypothetical protein
MQELKPQSPSSTLPEGRYWMQWTAASGRTERQVLVSLVDGVLRAQWTDADWEPITSDLPGDIGLCVLDLPPDTLFTPVATPGGDCEHDAQSQAPVQPLRDIHGDALRCGLYLLQNITRRQSQVIQIVEDEQTGDLCFANADRMQRIDDLDGGVLLTPVRNRGQAR